MAEFDSVGQIKDMLDQIARKIGLQRPTETARMFAAWSEIVGKEVAARAEPESLRDGVLRLRTSSGAWAAQIKYLGHDIAKKINAELGTEIVTEVKAFVAPRSSDTKPPEHGSRGSSEKVEKIPPRSPKTKGPQPVLEGAEEIADDRLREATKRAHLAAKMRKKRG